jgi:hypothetical protein
MTIDEYFVRIDQIAKECLADCNSAPEAVYSQGDRQALIDLRLQLLDDSDVESSCDFLRTGIFTDQPQPARLSLFLITLDVERQIARLEIRARCQAYAGSVLLSKLPKLSDYVVDDLIVAAKIRQLRSTDIVEAPGGFARIDALLSPSLAAWALGSFPAAKVRIRLDPREAAEDPLKPGVRESVVRPPNPTWWRNLGLRRGTTDGGHFVLDPEQAPGNLRNLAFWDQAKGIRRLEVFVKRENQGRLSMMVEELSVRNERNGFIEGRCIHLDSRSPEGTPFEDAELDHIDLAINVFQDDAGQARLEQRLADGGKTIDATCRTHLLRIDGPRFPVLFDCALGFLKSRTLLFEWWQAQFPSSENS